jgi:hypothetical protein
MSTDADKSPQITMVPVKRYDVTLTLDDILTPLTQTTTHLNTAGLIAEPENPDTAQLLQRFTELVSELKEVVNQINQIDPSLLASKPGPPPSA